MDGVTRGGPPPPLHPVTPLPQTHLLDLRSRFIENGKERDRKEREGRGVR